MFSLTCMCTLLHKVISLDTRQTGRPASSYVSIDLDGVRGATKNSFNSQDRLRPRSRRTHHLSQSFPNSRTFSVPSKRSAMFRVCMYSTQWPGGSKPSTIAHLTSRSIPSPGSDSLKIDTMRYETRRGDPGLRCRVHHIFFFAASPAHVAGNHPGC